MRTAIWLTAVLVATLGDIFALAYRGPSNGDFGVWLGGVVTGIGLTIMFAVIKWPKKESRSHYGALSGYPTGPDDWPAHRMMYPECRLPLPHGHDLGPLR